MRRCCVAWVFVVGLFYGKPISAKTAFHHTTLDNHLIKEAEIPKDELGPPFSEGLRELDTNSFENELEEIYDVKTVNPYETSSPYYDYERVDHDPSVHVHPYFDPTGIPYFDDPGSSPSSREEAEEAGPPPNENYPPEEPEREVTRPEPPETIEEAYVDPTPPPETLIPTFPDIPYMMAIPVQLQYFLFMFNSDYDTSLEASTEEGNKKTEEVADSNVLKNEDATETRGHRIRRALSRVLGLKSDDAKGQKGSLVLKDKADCGGRWPGGNGGNNGGNNGGGGGGIDPRGSGDNPVTAAADAAGNAVDAVSDALRIGNRRTTSRRNGNNNRNRGRIE